MGKNYSKKKKQKPFNPIRNVEKLQELRPKLRKLESYNSGSDPISSSHYSEEKKKVNFSGTDREIILHIRELFSRNGEMPEYREKSNSIIFSMKGVLCVHPLFISCYRNVLNIISVKSIDANNSSVEALKYIMNLNIKILLGGFCYIPEGECIRYNLTIPLYEKPKKEFMEGIILYTVDVLDDHVPEIISCIHGANHWKKEGISPTFH